jgi:hypothetical protein
MYVFGEFSRAFSVFLSHCRAQLAQCNENWFSSRKCSRNPGHQFYVALPRTSSLCRNRRNTRYSMPLIISQYYMIFLDTEIWWMRNLELYFRRNFLQSHMATLNTVCLHFVCIIAAVYDYRTFRIRQAEESEVTRTCLTFYYCQFDSRSWYKLWSLMTNEI